MAEEFSLKVNTAPAQAIQDARQLVSQGSTPQNVRNVCQALIDLNDQAEQLAREIERMQESLRRRGYRG